MNYSKPAMITLLLVIAIGTSACSTTPAKVESSKPAETTEMKSDDRSKENTKKENSNQKSDHNEADRKDGDGHKDGEKGSHSSGQTVEIDGYHIELKTHKEDKVTHLDIALQKGEKHEVVMGAKVTADIKLSDGTSKTLALPYKEAEKVYSTDLSDLPPGEYKLIVLSEIGDKKVTARFTTKL